MSFKINTDDPVIKEEDVLEISLVDLDAYYVETQHSYKQYDLFFVLLSLFNRYLDSGKKDIAAHLSFLMAYYLFMPLTPAESLDLAYYYIKKAVELNPRADYVQWRNSIAEDAGD